MGGSPVRVWPPPSPRHLMRGQFPGSILRLPRCHANSIQRKSRLDFRGSRLGAGGWKSQGPLRVKNARKPGGPEGPPLQLAPCILSLLLRIQFFARTRGRLRRASPALRDCALLESLNHKSTKLSTVFWGVLVGIDPAESRSGGTRGAGWPKKVIGGAETPTFLTNREGWGGTRQIFRKGLAAPLLFLPRVKSLLSFFVVFFGDEHVAVFQINERYPVVA